MWVTATLRAVRCVCVTAKAGRAQHSFAVSASIITEDGIHKEAEVVSACSLSTLRPGVSTRCSTHEGCGTVVGCNLRCELRLGLVTTAVNVSHACQSFFFFVSVLSTEG